MPLLDRPVPPSMQAKVQSRTSTGLRPRELVILNTIAEVAASGEEVVALTAAALNERARRVLHNDCGYSPSCHGAALAHRRDDAIPQDADAFDLGLNDIPDV